MPRDGAPGRGPELRPVVDVVGYSVDADGRVYSHLTRVGLPGGGSRVVVDPAVCRLVVPEPDTYGYRRVRLYGSGRRVWRRVNVVVCRAWHGEAPWEGLEACHLDGDRTNNRASNLVWGTRAENTEHRRLHGTVLSGSDHPAAAFDDAEVEDVLEEYFVHGFDCKVIAALRGVSVFTIRNLVSGRTYRDHQPAVVGG